MNDKTVADVPGLKEETPLQMRPMLSRASEQTHLQVIKCL